MGQDTRLLLNSKWELGEIRDVMESSLDLVEKKKTVKGLGGKRVTVLYKIKVDANPDISIGTRHFSFQLKGSKESRWMYVRTNSVTPLGSATLLSLGHNDEAIMIMRTIADVLGGFLMENDCSSDYKEIIGKLSNSDGLPYFIKYAIIKDKLDSHDLRGLNDSIHKWYDRVDPNHRDSTNLFPRSKTSYSKNKENKE